MNLPNWLYDEPALPVENPFDRFVKSFGGQKIENLLPDNLSLQNVDYLFYNENIIVEMKTLQTEFGTADSFGSSNK
jgi:hypothetical protein